VLPLGTLNISVPIKLWRVRKSTHADTSADAVENFAALGEVWSAVKGGDVGDLPKGFHLRGVSGGAHSSAHLSTKLRWNGANDSVMIGALH
jgi:hypothetical protein